MFQLTRATEDLRSAAERLNPPVLLIEDYNPFIYICQATLKNTCKLAIARNNEEALEQFYKVKPVLIITDSAGFKAVQQLNAEGFHPSVLVLTGAPDVEDKAKALQALDGRTKPFGTLTELRDWVGYWLDHVQSDSQEVQ